MYISIKYVPTLSRFNSIDIPLHKFESKELHTYYMQYVMLLTLQPKNIFFPQIINYMEGKL